jgi:lipoate-protein ligase A
MKVLDLSFPDPQQNLSYDDELLLKADKAGGGEVLRFWESPKVFVVLGRTCDESGEVYGEVCSREGVSVLRRSSGGGTVVQGPGCLNVSLVLSKARHSDFAVITRSYEHILKSVITVLGSCGIKAEFRPVCDLVTASGEKKFSGNAQRRGRSHILHHGTILYHFDLSLIPRYLKMPPKMPDYRRFRSHGDFITNVNLDVPRFKKALAFAWDAV